MYFPDFEEVERHVGHSFPGMAVEIYRDSAWRRLIVMEETRRVLHFERHFEAKRHVLAPGLSASVWVHPTGDIADRRGETVVVRNTAVAMDAAVVGALAVVLILAVVDFGFEFHFVAAAAAAVVAVVEVEVEVEVVAVVEVVTVAVVEDAEVDEVVDGEDAAVGVVLKVVP